MNDAAAPTGTPPDPDVLQRQAADPEASVWVGASAGTGKTKVLTDRVLSLMLGGTLPHRILCLTFTRAAAAEMNQRIAEQLSKWATLNEDSLASSLAQLLGRPASPDETTLSRQLFVRVLDSPGGMNIQTIHAFCQSLLGRFPLEAGIAPHFSVVDERDADEMLADAARQVLLHAEQTSGALAHAVGVVTGHVVESRFQALVQMLAAEAARLRATIAAYGSIAAVSTAIETCLAIEPGETPERIVAAACEDGAFALPDLRAAVAALTRGTATDAKRAAAVGKWLTAAPIDRAAHFANYAHVFVTLNKETNLPQVKALKSLATQAVLKVMPAAESILQQEGERLVDVQLRMRAAITAEASTALLTFAGALLDIYAAAKQARAVLDYDDLVQATARLLERDGSASWVLFKLDGGIDHVLIDEAQDTNPDQWRVIRALTTDFFSSRQPAAHPRTVFAVGDVKQSIFSFQGAEPAEFLTNRRHFASETAAAERLFRPVDLTVSFRSTDAVLAAVDAVFARSEAHDGVALDGQPILHRVSRRRQKDGGQVELWPEVVGREEDAIEPWKPPIDRIDKDAPHARLARLVAGRIARMVKGSEILPSKGRPIQAGDIMILVRRRDAFVDQLVRALKDRDVAVAGVDRMVLTEQIAVMDLIALGRFVLLPDDDLTLAAVLKSPLLDLDEEQLFRLAHGRPGTLWQALRATAEDPAFTAAHAFLATVMTMADQVPPFEFFSRILGPMQGRRRFFARLGHEADEPITEFLDLAMRYERNHPPTLEGFLHWLETAAVQIKRDMEQATRDAIRVMTVHGAKGLQAPIVFLPDTMKVPQPHRADRPPPILWSEAANGRPPLPLWGPRAAARVPLTQRLYAQFKARQQQEYRRLLYVAMTRAEDYLIVCGWRAKQAAPEGCWYQLIKAGLDAAAGSEWIEEPYLAAAQRSGEFDAEPRVLRLATPQRTEAVPERPAEAAQPQEGLLPQWAKLPAAAETSPPLRPLAPSRAIDSDDPPVRPPLTLHGRGGYRRGQIIHRLLQSLPQMAPASRGDAVHHWLARQARILSADDQNDIARQVLAIVDDPTFAPLFGPNSLAEVPISGEVEGRLLSARVDRLVIDVDHILFLDYKTDRPPPRRADGVPPVYLRQMALYRRALQCAFPNRSIECVLLWTDVPRLMPIAADLLDRFTP